MSPKPSDREEATVVGPRIWQTVQFTDAAVKGQNFVQTEELLGRWTADLDWQTSS